MTRKSGNRFLTIAELEERIAKAVGDARMKKSRGRGDRDMTESECRGEDLADECEKVDAFQTALQALVEDAAGKGFPLEVMAIILRTEANSLLSENLLKEKMDRILHPLDAPKK